MRSAPMAGPTAMSASSQNATSNAVRLPAVPFPSSGEWQAGQQLPSVPQLATELPTSRTTVTRVLG